MKNMTHKERVAATLAGELPDRCPVNDFSMNTMVKNYGRQWKDCRFNAAESAKATAEWLKYTEIDMFFGPVETKAMFMDLPGLDISFPDDDQGSLKSAYFETPEDIESKEFFDFGNRKVCPGLYKGVVEPFLEMRKRNPTGAMSCCWSEGVLTTAGYLRGIEQLLMDMLLEPELANKAISRGREYCDGVMRATHAGNSDFVTCTDPVSSAALITPEMFTEYNLEPTKKNIAGWKKDLGIPVLLHICGETTPMLDHFAETGTDIMSLDHIVDMAEARRIVGRKMTLMGNLDPVALMQGGTPASINKAAKKCIGEAGAKGMFVLGPGCAMPRDTPKENVRALTDASKQYHY